MMRQTPEPNASEIPDLADRQRALQSRRRAKAWLPDVIDQLTELPVRLDRAPGTRDDIA
jgi:hypothetical protein